MARRFGTIRAAARLMRVGSLLAGNGWLRKALQGTVIKPARVLRAVLKAASVLQPPRLPAPAKPRAPRPGAKVGFFCRSFSSAHGQRLYKLYIPPTRHKRPMPLLIMLHGCTQSADDFAAGTRMNVLARKHGFLVAYPEQPSTANAQKCWNWFRPDNQRRDHGEPALIAGIALQVAAAQRVDPHRIYVAGLSAGGAMAAIMGTAYPDVFAAIGVHSGVASGAASGLRAALRAMRHGGTPARTAVPHRVVPTIVFHADRDTTVNARNGDQVLAQAAGGDPALLHRTVRQGQVPGGHAFTRTLFAAEGAAPVLEQWVVHGGGHAWSGGDATGTYTDPRGPDASLLMVQFFLAQAQPRRG